MSRVAKDIMRGLGEAISHVRGEGVPVRVHRVLVPPKVDVAALRARLGLSQTEFAERFGFTKRAVENWEQGDREPKGSARTLLYLIAREPETISRLLSSEQAA